MSGEKILLAADDTQLLSEFLERQGYAVTVTTDGHQALAAIEAEEFPLALINLKLPGISGLELLSHVKSKSPDTQVILLTGPGELESASQALRLGACDYLVKSSLRLPELQLAVARALEQYCLTQSHRELMDQLRQTQEDVERRWAAELSQIRQASEALAAPLTWRQLFEGLFSLIWQSLSIKVLGLEALKFEEPPPLGVYRCQPELADTTFQNFKVWLQEQFYLAQTALADAPAQSASPEPPLPAILCEKVEGEDVLALVAVGREESFSDEETELFRIFVLQGKAALKNLLLFEQVQSLAVRDAATGLYNYRYFMDALRYEVKKSSRYKTPLSLLFLDIDDFQTIKKNFGQILADEILRQVGTLLRGRSRSADLLCRYNGDEFVLLLSQTLPERALVLAERLRGIISQATIKCLNQDLQVTISIGVAALEPGMTGEALVNAAIGALYQAKEARKN